MLNVFSKGRRKSYDCFTIEVRLKNRTLWGYRSTYPYSQHKGVPLPWVSAQPRAIEFLWQKFSAIFSATISLRKFQTSPNKDLAFVTVPFSLMLHTRHLRRHFCETLHVLRSDKQTCGHDLKVKKKASKYKSEQNFSLIKKLLIACEILV